MFKVFSFMAAFVASALFYSTMVLSDEVYEGKSITLHELTSDLEDVADLLLPQLSAFEADILESYHGDDGYDTGSKDDGYGGKDDGYGGKDDGYDQYKYRCNLVVVIVDLQDNFSRKRHEFSGQGRNWKDARWQALESYRSWINKGRFWQNRYNHSFAYRSCS